MQITSTYYSANAARPVGEVIRSSLVDVVSELVIRAGYNMDAALGSDVDHKRQVGVITDILKRDFKYLPLHRVAEGFYRGSLGELEGTTKLSIRNIIIWMRGIEATHKQHQMLQARLVKSDEPKEKSCQYGAAAIKLKLQWRLHNRISADDWDHFPLEKIFELIRAGRKPETILPDEVYEFNSNI